MFDCFILFFLIANITIEIAISPNINMKLYPGISSPDSPSLGEGSASVQC